MDEYIEDVNDFEEELVVGRCFRCRKEFPISELIPIYDEYLEFLINGDDSFYGDDDDEMREAVSIYLCGECKDQQGFVEEG